LFLGVNIQHLYVALKKGNINYLETKNKRWHFPTFNLKKLLKINESKVSHFRVSGLWCHACNFVRDTKNVFFLEKSPKTISLTQRIFNRWSFLDWYSKQESNCDCLFSTFFSFFFCRKKLQTFHFCPPVFFSFWSQGRIATICCTVSIIVCELHWGSIKLPFQQNFESCAKQGTYKQQRLVMCKY